MIGYYVHHQGSGHLTRARSVAARMSHPVTVLSSIPAPAALGPFAGWVGLESDAADVHQGETAGGVFHWAPRGVAGLTSRMATLARWVDEVRPEAVVVDVSVEVSVFLRLMGIPTVVLAMPGDRTDAPHRLAYDVADRIVAPWSRAVYRPDWLVEHDAKTVYTGAISRHADRTDVGVRGNSTVAVLAGAGGSAVTLDLLDRARAVTPTLTWRGVGVPGTPWIDDVWPILTGAAVVVTHAGQNAVADVAAAGAPAVVIADDRPHGEQHATARAVDAAGLAVGLDRWPSDDRWPALLERAMSLHGHARETMQIDGAAARAAAAIDALAAENSIVGAS